MIQHYVQELSRRLQESETARQDLEQRAKETAPATDPAAPLKQQTQVHQESHFMS